MKLRALKVRSDEIEERNARGTLRVVEGATQIIEWPYPATGTRPGAGLAAAEPEPEGGIVVKAEVQTKRFHGRTVDAERYTATVRAKDGSPHAIMAALTEACGRIDDFRSAGGPDDQIILQISLRG